MANANERQVLLDLGRRRQITCPAVMAQNEMIKVWVRDRDSSIESFIVCKAIQVDWEIYDTAIDYADSWLWVTVTITPASHAQWPA